MSDHRRATVFPLPLPAGVTSCEVAGPEDAPAVALIHGLTSAAFVWDRTVRALAGYRTLRFDLYGRGGSARPRGVPHDLALFLAQASGAVAHAFGERPLALVGYSWGCGLTAAWAARNAQRVTRVVLVAPGGLGGAYGASFAALRTPMLGEAIAAVAGKRALLADARRCFADPASQPGFLAAFEAQLARPGYARSLLSTLRCFPPDLVPLYGELAATAIPVDVLWGTADRKAPFTGAEQLRAVIPRARVHAIEGAEHGLMLEHAGAFEGKLLEVLRERAPATP